MKFLFPLAAAIMLAGCAFTTGEKPDDDGSIAAYTRVDVKGPEATAEERAACAAVGGEINRAGMLGREHCVQNYPDAGNACRGEADCLGTCRSPDGALVAGQKTIGKCQGVDVPFGCYAQVEGGVVQPTLCVD